MTLADVTDQLTDVSSVDVMIARVVGVVLAIVIAGLILLLLVLLRRVRTMASTLGQPPADDQPADGTDKADKTIAAMTSLSVDQGNEILAALKFDRTLAAAHFAEVDRVLAERGPIIDRLVTDVDDLKATRHDQGERIGTIETDVSAIKARLESATCLPITPTTGG